MTTTAPKTTTPIRILIAKPGLDIIVFGGGIIPKDDVAKLKTLGVKEIFLPGTSTTDVVAWIRGNVPSRS